MVPDLLLSLRYELHFLLNIAGRKVLSLLFLGTTYPSRTGLIHFWLKIPVALVDSTKNRNPPDCHEPQQAHRLLASQKIIHSRAAVHIVPTPNSF